jgi:hypothetical protein
MKLFKFALWAEQSWEPYRKKTKESLGTLELEWEEDDLEGAWNRVYQYRERANKLRSRAYQQLIGDIDLLEDSV